MRAKRDGKCRICATAITAGADIEKLCGEWVHEPCKKDELTRRIVQKDYVEVVPTDTSIILRDDYVGTRYYRRRGVRFTKLAIEP